MKLCRICDHELGPGGLCPVCRRFCRNPLILPEGVYLNKAHSAPDVNCEFHKGDRKETILNRRHPENERDCSYHNPAPSPGGLRRVMNHAKTGKSRDMALRMEQSLRELLERNRPDRNF